MNNNKKFTSVMFYQWTCSNDTN